MIHKSHGTVSKNNLLEGLNRVNGTQTYMDQVT